MALSTGTKAPNFTLPTKVENGVELITLKKYAHMCNVVLLFFPMAFTETCTEEMCTVSREYARYVDLGAAVLGISGDNPFVQAAWAEKEEITFPLLSDYEHQVAQRYDVAYESFLPKHYLGMGGVAKRAAFIVDVDGIIQYAESHDDSRRLPDFDAITTRLESLKLL